VGRNKSGIRGSTGLGFPADQVKWDEESRPPELSKRSGTRAAIKDFTKVSRDHFKFTLRNAMCDWLSFCTLTYPADFPSDVRVCKKHLN
jgi:hypothetical protein